MGFEIERKFLVTNDTWRGYAGEGSHYSQGYLSTDPEHTVRVRIAGDKGFLTVKSASRPGTPLTRFEFEYEIPLDDAHQMIDAICGVRLITKKRYEVPFEGQLWIVDEFLGPNAGLIVTEIEMENEQQAIKMPPWVGQEVSLDLRYSNAALSKLPFTLWG